MLKPYEKYKPIPELWLTQVPDHWSYRKIKYLFYERCEKGYPQEPLLVASQNMGVVPKDVYGNRTVEAQKDLHLLKLVKVGDFVISLRSFQGGIEYAYYQGIISPAYTVMVPKEESNSGYFRHLAKSRLFIELLRMCVTGIREGQNIDYIKLKNHLIPIPPREEQDQIVRFLDWKLAQINKLIRAKKKQIELLNEQKQVIINNAVTKGLDPNVPMKDSGIEWIGIIPKHWKIVSLRRIAKCVKTGTTPSGAEERFYSDDGLNWFTPCDFSDDINLTVSQRKLSAAGICEVTVFPPMSVLLIGIGGTMGKVCVATEEFSCNQQVNSIICNNEYDPVFLVYYLRAIRTHVFATAKFTTLPILNQEETKKIFVPLLPFSEQKNIVNYLNNINKHYCNIIKKLKDDSTAKTQVNLYILKCTLCQGQNEFLISIHK